MSTRGAFGFYVDGKVKVTYNHCDSYLDGLGLDIVKFLDEAVENSNLETIKNYANKLKVVSEKKKPTKKDIKALEPYTDLSVSHQSTSDWYCLLRGCQGSLISVLESGYILDGLEFTGDSLFCEYAYVVDLDNLKFDVYYGFQKEPHTEGLFQNVTINDSYRSTKYYPCKRVKSFDINNKLKANFTKWMEKENNKEE